MSQTNIILHKCYGFFVRVQLTISILPRSIMLMIPPIWTQMFKQFQDCVDVKLTGAAAESRNEHHIPLSTSSLGSWKSGVEGARRSDRLITRWSVKSPSARFALQLQAKSDFYEAEVSSHIITAWSDDDELNCGVAPPWCQQAGRVFGVFFPLNFLGWLGDRSTQERM